jgi:hypothetical protein
MDTGQIVHKRLPDRLATSHNRSFVLFNLIIYCSIHTCVQVVDLTRVSFFRFWHFLPLMISSATYTLTLLVYNWATGTLYGPLRAAGSGSYKCTNGHRKIADMKSWFLKIATGILYLSILLHLHTLHKENKVGRGIKQMNKYGHRKEHII